MTPSPRKLKKPLVLNYDRARDLALALPGVEEASSYGTPALKVKGKLLARLKEDGETLVVRTDFLDRDFRVRADPATFFVTDHYRNYPYVLVRLSSVRIDDLSELLEQAWRHLAPARLVSAHGKSRVASKSSDR